MYTHLINWKWSHITKDPGEHLYRGRPIPYDAILPDRYRKQEQFPHVYEPVTEHLLRHRRNNPFRIHKHFYHMASSQVANLNLFLPILHSPQVNLILGSLKPDFKELAKDHLDQGYCIEYWGDNYHPGGKGPLGDKSAIAGTDADIAIAYRNYDGQLCLWLVEHKLTEPEFTTCGGFRSRGRKEQHDCAKAFSAILHDKSTCYYHDVRKFKYWDITAAHHTFFRNHPEHEQCPFQGGMNQLWRIQLLALSIENDDAYPFEQACFSVVRHPKNDSLVPTIEEFCELTAGNKHFFSFTSSDVLACAEAHADPELSKWIEWYKELYNV
jgi:hypothetical protein